MQKTFNCISLPKDKGSAHCDNLRKQYINRENIVEALVSISKLCIDFKAHLTKDIRRMVTMPWWYPSRRKLL